MYKQGSAGITKASVSITFHNDDPANGPSGYEDKELITVTRQVGLAKKKSFSFLRLRGRGCCFGRRGAQAGGWYAACAVEQRRLQRRCCGCTRRLTDSVCHTLLSQSPQIVIGGRDKYLINGHAAQQGSVGGTKGTAGGS